MRILLTGGSGQVGSELHRTLLPLGEVIAPTRQEFDLSQPESLREIVIGIKPDFIVNAAAFTAVDRAEKEPHLAYKINSEAPKVIAEVSKEINASLIHFSTDYVFNGSGNCPFDEESAPDPINVYGKSKLAGEEFIRKNCPEHIILRTSWVYSLRGTNFLLTMQRLMKESKELRIVDDQFGAPTLSSCIAEATSSIVMKMNSPDFKMDRKKFWGTYHLTNGGEASWFSFAQAILDLMIIENKPKLIPIPSSEHPSTALRPLNSRLSNKKLEQVFGITLPHWRIALCKILQNQ